MSLLNSLKPDNTPTEGVRVLEDNATMLRLQCGLKETAFDRKTLLVIQNDHEFCRFSDVQKIVVEQDTVVGEEQFPPRLAVSLHVSRWRSLRVAFIGNNSEAVELANRLASVVGTKTVSQGKLLKPRDQTPPPEESAKGEPSGNSSSDA